MGREEYCEGEGKHFCKEFTSTCHLVLRTLDGTLACISTGCTTDYSTNRCVTRVITACHRAKCGTCQGKSGDALCHAKVGPASYCKYWAADPV